jgi:hypothetical protein
MLGEGMRVGETLLGAYGTAGAPPLLGMATLTCRTPSASSTGRPSAGGKGSCGLKRVYFARSASA